MFHHLRKVSKWLEKPYPMVRQIIKTNDSGENYIAISTDSVIYANIQNKKDGESMVPGLDGALAYRTILLLSKNRIGFGDPVYPDDQTIADPSDSIIYFIKAFGQVYRISLEAGIQDLSYDSSATPESTQQSTYVMYRYNATLVRGPWQ